MKTETVLTQNEKGIAISLSDIISKLDSTNPGYDGLLKEIEFRSRLADTYPQFIHGYWSDMKFAYELNSYAGTVITKMLKNGIYPIIDLNLKVIFGITEGHTELKKRLGIYHLGPYIDVEAKNMDDAFIYSGTGIAFSSAMVIHVAESKILPKYVALIRRVAKQTGLTITNQHKYAQI